MTPSDLSQLLAPIDDASPAGPNLEYDPDFAELERIATPTAERSVGDSVKAAQEPDWDAVAHAAQALFARSKDLRVAMHLLAAWTRRQGLAGWCAGLAVVHGLLERYWDDVHPQLDTDDDNDPTARANALMPLGDPQSVLGYFRATPFVQSPRIGRFSLRDLRIATGGLPVAQAAADAPLITLVELEACCMDCPEAQLHATAAALATAHGHIRAIDALLSERLGTASPDLTQLHADIGELKKFVESQAAKRFPGFTQAPAADAGKPAVSSPAVRADSGKIQGNDDVIRRLDEICEYYERTEPSSPVPILMRRARGLIGRSFLDLLKNVAPNGLPDLQILAGPEEEE
ncbi:type VI secretion system protein TssA [Paraburkholderia solisilvae]|uniref:ImpA N-terminal domain-containing protein n=1 Tax=Paraburkholderia solisilvae TaxID=624376 RepID=A0A6J5F333_9BURK|nr:type VI secretion system protein TssA [Paraburkholderia solisilvae]CAB3771656.1 hypothetical protein LMG29739_06078 [Paraburkholderia solisilvae]